MLTKTIDQARLPLEDEVVSASGIDEPHFNHATLDKVKVSLFLNAGVAPRSRA